MLQIELTTSGWRALEEPRSSDAVRGGGTGINAVGPIPRFLDLLNLNFFLVAQDYNLLDHDVLDHFPRCEAADVSIIVGALFASGILATGAVQFPSPTHWSSRRSPAPPFPSMSPATCSPRCPPTCVPS